MKEKDFINTIKDILNSKYIGDDCAYLKDLGIVITQDSLVEDVHFSREFASAYQIGYKAVMVNISDVLASGAEPAYLTISLSLPNEIENNFIKDFYKGAQAASNGAEIVGGDITGAEKIYISVTAIGKTTGRKISSRSQAKIGQKIIVSDIHGSSAAGLQKLLSGKKTLDKFTRAHLLPTSQIEFSQKIAQNIKEDYAMMDTSDGLMDALMQIANSSNVLLSIDFDKIPYDNEIKQFENWQELILFGGEDYKLIATVPDEYTYDFAVIGEVQSGEGVEINYSNEKILYTQKDIENKLYNHFKEKS